MSIESVLAAGRRAAEARMTSRCTIRRKAGTSTDPDTGFTVPLWEDVYVDLPCLVDWQSTSAHIDINVGGTVEMTRARRVLKVRHDATAARNHDVAEIKGGACDGVFFTMTNVVFADQKKQQEIPIVETSRPEGWT